MQRLKIIVVLICLFCLGGVLAAEPPALKQAPKLKTQMVTLGDECPGGICSVQESEPVKVKKLKFFPRLRAMFHKRAKLFKSRLKKVFGRCCNG